MYDTPVKMLCVTVLLLNIIGCSAAPITPSTDPEPIGKGNKRSSFYMGPALATEIAFGLTDRIDAGLSFEQLSMGVGWLKFSNYHSAAMYFSTNVGVFFSGDDSYVDGSGFYVGTALTGNINDRFSWFSGYRLSRIDYKVGEPVLFSSNVKNRVDLSRTSQLEVGFGIRIFNKSLIRFGIACQHHHLNSDPDIDTDPCAPIIGLSSTGPLAKHRP